MFARLVGDKNDGLPRAMAVDSLRGSPGTFLPIADMTIDKATRGEMVDNADFRGQYARQDLTEAPREYRFPFLQWLRNLDVAFQLSSTTLTADIRLEVQRPLGGTRVSRGGGAEQKRAPLATEGSTTQPSAPATPSKSSVQPVRDSRQLQAGDWVVTLDEAVKFRLGRTTLARLSRGQSLKVLETRGNWIGVQRTQEKRMLLGWVHWRHLCLPRKGSSPVRN